MGCSPLPVEVTIAPVLSARSTEGEKSPLIGWSGVANLGDHLFLVNDETRRIEWLQRSPLRNHHFDQPQKIKLAKFFHEIRDEDSESDLEGLCFDDGYLWVVGSHASKRVNSSGPENWDKLEKQKNRYLLGRIHLGEHPSEPSRKKSACLHFWKFGNDLTEKLLEDPLLRPFMKLPAKDNGFDIEGLAVRGDKVFLGLRGPVINGHAIIIELKIVEEDGELVLDELKNSDQLYRLHFIDLAGHGIRDLCVRGDDLLILTGPTMKLRGQAQLYLWPGAFNKKNQSAPAKVCDLIDSEGAEGACLYSVQPGEDCLLVVFDNSPGQGQLGGLTSAKLYPLD